MISDMLSFRMFLAFMNILNKTKTVLPLFFFFFFFVMTEVTLEILHWVGQMSTLYHTTFHKVTFFLVINRNTHIKCELRSRLETEKKKKKRDPVCQCVRPSDNTMHRHSQVVEVAGIYIVVFKHNHNVINICCHCRCDLQQHLNRLLCITDGA